MAKSILTATEKFTKRHAVNIGTAVSLQEMAGTKIMGIQAAAIVEDNDRETGESKAVAVFVDSDGVVYTSISSVVMEQMDDIIDLINDGEMFDLTVMSRKAKGSNREFLSVVVC